MTATRAARLRLSAAAFLWAALLTLAVVRYAPPPVVPADAPPDVFSAERAFATLEALLEGVGAHPTGSEANERVRARLVDALRDRGWEPSLQRAHSCGRYDRCADVVNVIARRPDADDARPVLLLSAHYDSTARGPGAADDGAGVAALLEVARILRDGPASRNEVALLFTDGEELGLLGAEAFTLTHPLAPRVRSVVNLEARGTSGASILFRASEGAAPQVQRFGAAAPRPVTNSIASAVFSLMPNDTDLSVFLAADHDGLDFAFIGSPRHYHAPTDDLAHLDHNSLQHHGDNALAAARALADAPLEPGDPAVWTDVMAYSVVALSQRWMLAASALALALCFAVALVRRDDLALRGALLGAGALIGGVAVAFGAGLALARITAPGSPWAADPTPYVALAHVLGAVAFALGGLLVRRAGAEEVQLATTGLFAAGAVVLGLTLPGASYALGAPALVSAALLVPVAFGQPTTRIAGYGGALVSAVMLFPVGLLLYDALTHDALGPIAAAFFLALAPGLSLFAETKAERRAPVGRSPDTGPARAGMVPDR